MKGLISGELEKRDGSKILNIFLKTLMVLTQHKPPDI